MSVQNNTSQYHYLSLDCDSFNEESACDKTVAIVPPRSVATQSQGLSARLTQMNSDGHKLNDDSALSESTLSSAIADVVEYARERVLTLLGGEVVHKKNMSLYDCQECYHKVGGPEPEEENKRFYMKPDGGIIVAIVNGEEIPLLITEDKVQGTNDNLYEQNKKRQSTGNAIERAAKNIRGAEMIFSNMDVFPYALFASGCDLHHTETISKRIVMMNMGTPNHYIEVRPDKTKEEISKEVDDVVKNIKIKNVRGKSIASVFVKAHKWDVMKHRSSMWEKPEIVKICFMIVDLVLDEIVKTLAASK